jgi:hypothetical protein
LPRIDTIEATTDVRAFLTKGVPANLTKAALRRAWSSDPAIRDFIGLSENAWDFNAPETVPGFGGALPADEVQRILAQMMPSEVKPESPVGPGASSAEEIPAGEEDTGFVQAGGNSPQSEKHAFVKSDGKFGEAVDEPKTSQSVTIENKNEDVAVQNYSSSDDLPPKSTRPT